MEQPNDQLREARLNTPSRALPGEPMSRGELADAVNAWLWETTGKRYSLDAHTIARYERGSVRWPGAHYRSGLRHVLGVATDAALGFRSARSASSSGQRRLANLGNCGVEVELGVSAAEFVDRLSVSTPAPRVVGWTDVEQVRATTRALAASENLFGGGLSCEAAAGQLRWAARLLDARTDGTTRSALVEAVGNLAGVVAFSAFDIGNHDAATDCFRFALWCADEGQSWSLRAATLADMARQAAYTGRLDDGLSLIELAQVRSDRLTATGRAMLSTIRARLLGQFGRHDEAVAEVERGDVYFAERYPAGDPPWLLYYDEAEHKGAVGRALMPLAIAARSPGEAAERLAAAVRSHNDGSVRARALSRALLATLTMTVGDPRHAVSIAQPSIAEAAALHSARLNRELRTLNRVARRHMATPEVAELRHELSLVLTDA